MIISKPETYEDNMIDNINYILDDTSASINSPYGEAPVSEMNIIQRKFLNGIIRQNKPKKILELGVSAGGSSAIILNAINDIDNSFLHSIDYSDKYYRNPSKEVGWIVKEKFNNITSKWKLYTGATAANFIEEIGYDIDICLLDTMHINPGEFIDLLIILPYMKKGGIIILHDTSMHIYPRLGYSYTNGVLFSCLKGKKFNTSESTIKDVGNIGAVILDENIMEYVFNYFYLLTLPWQYLPKLEDIINIENIFSKHYESHLVKLFSNIFSYYYDILKKDEIKAEVRNIDNKLNKLIDSIAWWIPFKNKRNNVREELINEIINFNDEILSEYIKVLLSEKKIPMNSKIEKDIIELSKHKIYFYDYNYDNDFVYLKKDNINFVTDSYNQIIVKEVFCDNLYNIEKYIDTNKKYVFIDIGCNRGYTTLFYAKKEYCKKIYSYEIVKNIFEYTKENININPDIKDKVILHNFGLSNYDGKIKVGYCPFHDSVSTTNKDFMNYLSKSEKIEYIESDIRDAFNALKEIFNNNELEENIIMKIDTEGSEYEIFDSLLNNQKNIFDKIKLIIGEFHFGTKEIDKKLKKLGFENNIVNEREFVFYRAEQSRAEQSRANM